MADNITGVGLRVDELESAQIINNSSLFVISINGICKSLTFKNLISNFAYNGDSENAETNFYNVKEIDEKFNNIENTLDSFKNDINGSQVEIREAITVMNNNFSKLQSSLQTSISEALTSYNSTLNNTMNAAIKKVDDKIDEITAKEATLVHKSSVYDTNIIASNWSGEEAPYKNRIAVSKATSTNNIEVILLGTANKEQAEAWANCGILHGTQEKGYVTLIGYGDKPEINIPVRFIIRDDVV